MVTLTTSTYPFLLSVTPSADVEDTAIASSNTGNLLNLINNTKKIADKNISGNTCFWAQRRAGVCVICGPAGCVRVSESRRQKNLSLLAGGKSKVIESLTTFLLHTIVVCSNCSMYYF